MKDIVQNIQLKDYSVENIEKDLVSFPQSETSFSLHTRTNIEVNFASYLDINTGEVINDGTKNKEIRSKTAGALEKRHENNIKKSNIPLENKLSEIHSKLMNEFVEEILYDCSKCAFVTPRFEKLTSHTEKVHMKQFKCNRCDYSGLKDEFYEHIHQVHGDAIYFCGTCDFKSFHKGSVKTHEINVHTKRSSSTRTLKCKNCDFTGVKDDYYVHLQKVHGNVMHECNVCDFKSFHKESVYTHKLNTHA